jgi:hypothetical protein
VTLDPPRAIPPTAASLDEPAASRLGVEEGTALPETSFADLNLLQSLVSMSRSKWPVGPVGESVAKPDPALPRAIRIRGSVETARLVHRVEPLFRPMAPQMRIQPRAVRLERPRC